MGYPRSTETSQLLLPQQLDQFRQAVQRGRVFEPKSVVHRRRAADNGSGFNISSNTTLWGNDRAIANLAVTHHSDLSSQDDLIADLS